MADLFQLHSVNKLSEVAPFGLWLADAIRREQIIAVALRDRQGKIAFSTRDDAWVVDLKSPAGPISLGLIRTQLLDRSGLNLMSRNLARDLYDLVRYLSPLLGVSQSEIYNNVAPAFVGDLTSAANCVNQPVTPMGKFRKIEQDAFEISLLEPQFAHAIPAYYQKVGVPLAKLLAEAALFKGKREPEWWVSYSHLWVRVLAYFSGDPTLAWAFEQGRDPFEAVGNLLKVIPYEAELFLLWQTCGRDSQCFSNRFPQRLAELPEELTGWAARADKALPALSWACNQMMRAYWDTRTVETLYGRRLRPGNPAGEAVAFRVFGTVEDLLAVGAVSFWNNRPTSDTLIMRFDGGPAESLVRICGVGPVGGQKWSWIQTLNQLAPLASPLGTLRLQPIVTEAPPRTL